MILDNLLEFPFFLFLHTLKSDFAKKLFYIIRDINYVMCETSKTLEISRS